MGMLIDNVIVGQFLGETALGAMGVISPISLIFSAFGNICSGGSVLAAQALGKGNRDSVRSIFSVTLLFVLLAGGLLTVFGVLFAPQIAKILGAQGSLHQLAAEYLRGFFLGAIPTIMTTALMGFVKMDGSPRLPLCAIVVMTVTNIVLDLAMIFVFDLGMFGMALATTLAYCFAMLTCCLHFRKDYCTLRPARPQNVLRELSSVITTGAPTAVSRVCDTVKTITLNHLVITAAGAGAAAALNVRTQTSSLVVALILGVGQAITPLAGMFFGEEDKTALKAALKDTLRVGLTLSIATAVLLFLSPSAVAGLLGITDSEILTMAARAVRLFAVAMPLQLINMVLMNFYQSTRRTGMATMICLLQSLIYTTGFALLLVNPIGTDGVWLAFVLGEVFTLLTTLLCLTKRNHRFPASLQDIMLLPERFGADDKNKLELSIGNSMEEVMTISQGIYRFGDSRDMDRQLLHKLSLCIEEMAGNVVQHAFRPGERFSKSPPGDAFIWLSFFWQLDIVAWQSLFAIEITIFSHGPVKQWYPLKGLATKRQGLYCQGTQ